jgi:hypothetical protein
MTLAQLMVGSVRDRLTVGADPDDAGPLGRDDARRGRMPQTQTCQCQTAGCPPPSNNCHTMGCGPR